MESVPTFVLARQDWADLAHAWVTKAMPGATFDATPLHMDFYVQPKAFNKRLAKYLSAAGS